MTEPAVSVIIPAYNAEKTIDRTIKSVRAQDFLNLEIIIVDDGSTDKTADVARRHADEDARISVIRQKNLGVAEARNTGWRHAKCDLIAFIDADDLWSSTKITKQVRAIENGSEIVGLVYCYFARIDNDDNITETWDETPHEGDVLDQLLLQNFVGNGSTMLVTRKALEAAGGFDIRLRAAGAEGCDDYLMCCRVAEAFDYAVVPEILVGYRDVSGSVSSNNARMMRSWILAVADLKKRYPKKNVLLRRGVHGYAEWMIRHAVFNRKLRQVPPVLSLLIRFYPRVAARLILKDMPKLGKDILVHIFQRSLQKGGGGKDEKIERRRFEIGVIQSLNPSVSANEP
jgi:glycosyltransferase involved in cell wall biosynthesis